MSSTGRARTAAAVMAVSLLAAGCGGRGGDTAGSGSTAAASPGITDTEISLGSSYPFSGASSAASASGTAVGAYWQAVNARGGIKSADGKTRKVKWTALDDGYEPPKAVANIRRLVEQDQVFAVFNPLGTANNTAFWDYVNSKGVPDVFVYSGADKFYSDIKGHPWTMGWQVPYPTEGAIYAQYLKAQKPAAKVAVLYQNDDFGKNYLDGFTKAIAGTGITVVAKESYEASDPSTAPQVAKLAASGADTFFSAGTQKPTAQAIQAAAAAGWKPTTFVSSVAASIQAVLQPAGLENSKGVLSAAYYKDPSDPAWADDAGMKGYQADMAKYCDRCEPKNNLFVAGFAVAQMMEKAIEGMKEPTREGLMASVRDLKDVQIPVLLPGVTMNTSADDGYPLEAAQVMQFDGTRFQRLGDVIDVSDLRTR